MTRAVTRRVKHVRVPFTTPIEKVVSQFLTVFSEEGVPDDVPLMIAVYDLHDGTWIYEARVEWEPKLEPELLKR